jgi:Lar family restriction alleviation protein
MNEQLQPCPFCGGEAEIERYGNRRQSTIYACTMCGCRLETNEERNFGARWNERFLKKPLDEPDSSP